jgi:lysophospholipid hydrolase
MDNATGIMSASALAVAASPAAEQASGSWLGVFANVTLAIIHLLSSVIYWVVRITTFSIPSLLFSLFSTSLTVTMNATTLYAEPGLTSSLVSPHCAFH